MCSKLQRLFCVLHKEAKTNNQICKCSALHWYKSTRVALLGILTKSNVVELPTEIIKAQTDNNFR